MSNVFPNDLDTKALDTIKKYREGLEYDPRNKWPAGWIEDMAYSRWAADEIIKFVQNHLNEWTVIQSVHEIHQTFLEYSCLGNDIANPSEPTYIFQIAEQTADCILDMLYAYC